MSTEETKTEAQKIDYSKAERNEPCPCGSGKKFKKCHALTWRPEPIIHETAKMKMPPGMSLPEGFDPNSIDPAWIGQFQNAMKRLPRAQLQKFQTLMQKAMSGQDITAEAAVLEKTLPSELQNLMRMAPGLNAMSNMMAANQTAGQMDESAAKKVIEEAVKAGKISREEADKLLAGPAPGAEDTSGAESSEKASGIKRLWGKVTGKAS